jgi:hypothetical protein
VCDIRKVDGQFSLVYDLRRLGERESGLSTQVGLPLAPALSLGLKTSAGTGMALALSVARDHGQVRGACVRDPSGVHVLRLDPHADLY